MSPLDAQTREELRRGEWRLADWAKRGADSKPENEIFLERMGRAGASPILPHRVVEIAREVFPGTRWPR